MRWFPVLVQRSYDNESRHAFKWRQVIPSLDVRACPHCAAGVVGATGQADHNSAEDRRDEWEQGVVDALWALHNRLKAIFEERGIPFDIEEFGNEDEAPRRPDAPPGYVIGSGGVRYQGPEYAD